MKTIIKFICPFVLVLIAFSLKAQNIFPSTGAAGIGTTTPNTSSILEMKSTTKGLLTPRMTKAQRDAIASPATGLMIFQTDKAAGFYYYNGSAWTAVGGAGANKTLSNLTASTAVNVDLLPNANNILSLGSSTLAWKNIYAAGSYYIGPYKVLDISGTYNTFIGFTQNTTNTGTNNTFTGNSAGTLNTSGSYNTATGDYSFYYNTTGWNNTAYGSSTLRENTTGNSNTAIGEDAMQNNTTGSGNTAIGAGALYANTTGGTNTAIGMNATTGSSGLSNSTALGYYALTTASNQVRIGNDNVTSIGGYANWTNVSDGRVKKNIKQNVPGLAFINKLQPVTYNLDLTAADNIIQKPQLKDKDGKIIQPATEQLTARKQKEQILYTGFVAQDVEKVAKSLNYDFSGVDIPKNDKDLYGLRYSDFVVPLVKAVQELSKQNDELKKQNDVQQKINEDLQKQIDDLKSLLTKTTASTATALSQSQKTQPGSSFKLEQNFPNPFNSATTIKYFLPANNNNAFVNIYNNNGAIIKSVKLNGSGDGSIIVKTSELPSGAYQYTLVVNGKVIDTKQMISAK